MNLYRDYYNKYLILSLVRLLWIFNCIRHLLIHLATTSCYTKKSIVIYVTYFEKTKSGSTSNLNGIHIRKYNKVVYSLLKISYRKYGT